MTDAILSRAAEGERITPDEAVALYRDAPLEDLGAAADAVVRRALRRRDHVQRQRAPQPHQHLRGRVRLLRVRGLDREGRAGLRLQRRPAGRPRPPALGARHHRAAHRGRHDQGVRPPVLRGALLRAEGRGCRTSSLTALTAVEVDFIARISKVDHAEALRRLRAAGHDTMPGGGAEVFSPRVRKIIADRKVPGRDLARRAPRGPRPGPAHQRDPPVRPLRDARGAG